MQIGPYIAPGGGYPTIHTLKCWPEYIQPIIDGKKKFEIRKHDRDFQVGDLLELQEYNPINKSYTDRKILVSITHIMRGPTMGISNGYCIMSIDPIISGENKND
jgi:hypothetical protein